MGQVFDIIKPKPPKEKPSSGPKKKNCAMGFLGVVFILITVVFAYYLLKSLDFKIVDDNTPVETATRPTPAASEDDNTKKELPKPSEEGSGSRPESVGTTTIEKSTISIRVLNGAAQSGAAANTKTILEQQGFTVASTGTAKSLYSSSVIYYKKSEEKAKMVQAALPDLTPKLQQSSITGTYDILVVVGKK